ncbi:Exocyst complex component 1, partial [Paramuricea clavata]
VCTRYLPQRKPAFVNVNQQSIEETLRSGASQLSSSSQEDETIEDDYQQLAPGEEKDLDVTMSRYECAISNIEAFTEKLSRDLSLLDGANISSIMSSESQVKNIMECIDEGLKELDELEEKLERYDRLLQKARDHMEHMDEKNKRMQLERANHKKLSDEVQNVVDILDVPEATLGLLRKKSLSNATELQQCTGACKAVRDAMSAELSPGLEKLRAVKEQRDQFWNLCQEFATYLASHLKSVFQSREDETETLVKHSSELVIPSHNKIHDELAPYTELMLWLKEIDHSKFTELIQIYTQCFSKVYEKEIRDFFEVSKQRCSARSAKAAGGNLRAGSHLSLSRDEVSHASPMLSRVTKFDKSSTDSPQLNRRSPTGSLSSQDSILSSDSVSENRSRFDK